MSRGFKEEDPDVELEGIIEVTSAKAYLFRGNEWEGAEWIPKSQSTVVPTVDSEVPGACTIFIKAWLAEKNGWNK